MKKIRKGTISLVAVMAIALVARIILGVLLRPTTHVSTPADEALFQRARQLHHDALVVGAHDDVLTYIVDYQYDLAMDGNEADDRSLFLYYGFSWLPFPPRGDDVHADMDFTRIREGGHAIEDDLETLAEFHKLGVRYMTLTHSCSHNWADSSSD